MRRVFILGSIITSILLLAFIVIELTSPTTQAPEDSQAAVNQPTTPINLQTNYFIGAYYMPKPSGITHQWDSLYVYNTKQELLNTGRRRPLLGYYSGNDQLAMDWQIKWAVEGGLDFFVFDDYWSKSQAGPTYSTSIKRFINSQYTNSMNFAAMITSIGNTSDTPSAGINKFKNEIALYYKNNYFNRSNYLRIGGKPVVYIFNLNAVFGTSASNPSTIESALSAFENQAGTDVYWIYTTALPTEGNFDYYKQIGFDAISPYYIAPDITHEVNVNAVLNHSEFSNRSYNDHLKFRNKSRAANLKFISTVTTNFDERNRYELDTFLTDQTRFTTNPNISNSINLAKKIKSDLDSNPSTDQLQKSGKVILNWGAWNEWGEGSSIEPGITIQNQNDPFKIINSLATIFAGKPVSLSGGPNLDLSGGRRTNPNIDFSNQADLGLIYSEPAQSNLNLLNTGFAQVEIGESVGFLDIPTNFQAAQYIKAELLVGAICGSVNNIDCIDSLGISWVSTSCSSDINTSCQNNQTTFLQESVLVNAKNSCILTQNNFYKCTFNLADKVEWKNKIIKLRLIFFHSKKSAVKLKLKSLDFKSSQVTSTLTPTPTITQLPIATPLPTTITGLQACGPKDSDNNNRLNIIDYRDFSRIYGKATCSGSPINTGCGSRDSNGDGVLNIVDFRDFSKLYGKETCAI